MPMQSNRSSAGFTLIELMVTLVIATVLITIAVPAYTTQMQKSRRTDAKTAVLDLAAREERVFSTTNAYSSIATDMGYTAFPQSVGSGYYNVSVTVPNPPTSFIVKATPVAGGPQAADAQCTSFAVNQLGQQTATGTLGNACWP